MVGVGRSLSQHKLGARLDGRPTGLLLFTQTKCPASALEHLCLRLTLTEGSIVAVSQQLVTGILARAPTRGEAQ